MTELAGALRRIWVEGRPIERRAYVVGGVLFLSGLVHVAVLLVTGWTWIGPVSLRKAATFGLSFGLTVASLAWATSFLRLRARGLVLGVFVVTSVVETALISMQAWRGVPSHFNFETPFDTAVSMTLALGGGVLIVVGIVCTVAAFAGAGGLPPSMALAVRTGLVVLLVAFATGAVMVARGVTESRSGAAQLAYDTAGSLKPLHAVAMHVVLVLPALAWLLAHTAWAEERRLRLVWVAVVADAVLTAVIGYEAFADIPPLAPPLGLGVLTAAAAGVLAATGVVALRATLVAPRPA
jgi:hypothetical protein